MSEHRAPRASTANTANTASTAVLFDMDGLLVDSEPLWLEAETAVMTRLGASWTQADQVQLLGGSLDRTVSYLLAKATKPAPPQVVAEWLMSGVANLVRARGVPVQPGARELLAQVAAAGLPHALVTGSERRFMQVVLASTGMRFDALVCADDVSTTKPDPEPYLLAAKLLDVDPGRCFALEDSPNGVASAEPPAARSSRCRRCSRSVRRPVGWWCAHCSTCRRTRAGCRYGVRLGPTPRASTGVNPSAPCPHYDLDFK